MEIMTTPEKIMRILDDYKESFRDGSDGSYDDYFAIPEEEFGELTKEIMKMLNKN